MALALNLGPIFKPSEELASTAAGVSMVLLFILAAITEWVKGQGNLDKSDAAIIKIYSEWSRAALKAIGLENDEACPSTVEASLAAAENIELQEVAVLDKYGLAKNKDIGMMRIRSCPNIVGT